MSEIRTVSLMGLGAIGSAYLSKIAETLPMENIRVIAGGERARRYREEGVTVNGVTRCFPVAEPDSRVEPADLLLVAVKASQLPRAIRDMEGHVGPGTTILSLLNGITSEEEIGAVYGMDKLLYAYAIAIDATRTDEGVTCTSLGRIPFGERRNPPGGHSPRVQRVEAFFRRVGIAYEIPEDMMLSLWRKFMLNVGVNQTSAVLGAPYGVFQQLAAARELALGAMAEVIALSGLEGVCLTEQAGEEALHALDALSPQGKTSMLQDMEAGRKTEVEMFGGAVTALGKKHGVPTPVNEMLVQMIRIREGMAGLSL